MSNLRVATKEDFKVGAVLVCIVEGWEMTLIHKYDDGIWETRQKAVFESEADCYYIKQNDAL